MFIERKIELTFQLGLGATFAPGFPTFSGSEDGNNTVKLSGYRVGVKIAATAAGPGSGTASIVVYGLPKSTLFKLASLNQTTAQVQQNYVTVRVGDDKAGLAVVFVGQINLAQADMNDQPNTSLRILAIGNGLQSMQNIPPSSYPAGADAGVILSNLAVAGGMAYKNWGASKILDTWYSWGDVNAQIAEVCEAAGFSHFVDPSDKGLVLNVWPKGGFRGAEPDIPLVSAETGLVGYPTYSSWAEGGGIAVRTVFNPLLSVGSRCKVQSTLPVANGTWGVFWVSHDLESLKPDGQWFTTFHGTGFGNA
jgi:hypothetical protein